MKSLPLEGEGQAAGSRMKPVKVTESSRWSSLIPAVGLPPLVMPDSSSQGTIIRLTVYNTALWFLDVLKLRCN